MANIAHKLMSQGDDVVPLADRVRYMQLLRFAIAPVVIALRLVDDDLSIVSFAELGVATGGYLLVTGAAVGIWRLLRSRGLALFGIALIVDALYLAWLTYATGGATSPLRYLLFVHVIAVALLGSYRTGLKLAMWHLLLLWLVHYAQQAELIAPPPGSDGLDTGATWSFIAILWLVTLATAALSAVNERELRRRRVDLEALAGMATALEDAADPLAVADVTLRHVADAFTIERAVVVGVQGDTAVVLAERGLAPGDRTDVPLDRSVVLDRVRETRTTMLVTEFDANDDPWLTALFEGGHNFIVAPLSAEGKLGGVLVAEHTARGGARIERRVVATVERFVSHAALALRNAWLVDELNKLATTDGLTRIANRRTFDEALAREVNRAEREGSTVSLVIVDLDHFKKVNDEHGHQTGDDVLRGVAQALAATCRNFDIPARYGGEEFAVVLPRCDDLLGTAERLRRAVATAPTPIPVTASMGVARWPEHGANPAALIAAADAALYRSKLNGRDRVTIADQPITHAGPASEPTEAVSAG